MVSRLAKPHCGQVITESASNALIEPYLRTDEGKPALVVALISAAGVTLSGSNVTVAVLCSKSILASVTPVTPSSDFFTVIGHSSQYMFCTSSVAVFGTAANAAHANNTAMEVTIILRMTIPSSEKERDDQWDGQQNKQQNSNDPENRALARDDGRVGEGRIGDARLRPQHELSKRKREEQKCYPDQRGSIGFQGGEIGTPRAANPKRQ